MSGTRVITSEPRIMREAPRPEVTPALAEAVPKWIAEGPVSLADIRKAAFHALLKTGLPHSGSEDFSFIRVGEFLPYLGPPAAPGATGAIGNKAPVSAPLSAAVIESLLLPESRHSYAVLVDGRYAPELSHPGSGFRIAPLAGETLDAETRTALIHAVEEETDAAAALAMLFSPEPLVIQVAAKAAPASPLLLLHLRSGSRAGKDARPRVDTFMAYLGGRLSESRILVRHAVLSRPSEAGEMENVHTVALLEQGASLRFLEAGAGGEAEVGGKAEVGGRAEDSGRDVHFRKLSVRLARDARFTAISAHTGSRLTRNSFAIDLAGEGAEGEVIGAAVLTGGRQSHNFLRIRHLAPHCVSRQHFKSVAADQSRSSVDGTIFVAPGAQQTNAYQLINNLMLSDEARTDSKPRLMIHADDVKCSHGATTGKLDPAQQFYLESRGLPPSQARALLTVAFIAEVLEKAGETGGPGNFRDLLDHALLDTLKQRLPAVPVGGRHG